MSNKNRVDIKDGTMSEVLFEFEQVLGQLPSATGLPKLKEQPEVFDSVRRQLTRTMSRLHAGDEVPFFFGRDTTVLVECGMCCTYRITITW